MRETIIKIKKANIKIWVITGDKAKTAENIALSSGLFTKECPIEILEEKNLKKLIEGQQMEKKNK